jgi:integrase
VETQLGEKGRHHFGGSREYWTWRRSKQEPTPLRSLEIADAKINRELAKPLRDWRRNEWTPAVKATGLTHRPPYAMRHTYASFSIAAEVALFTLARRMGTSVEQIDKTYGHLLPDAAEHERGLLDAFDTRSDERGEAVGD